MCDQITQTTMCSEVQAYQDGEAVVQKGCSHNCLKNGAPKGLSRG